MGMQLSGSLQLTGSLNVSGSTYQIGTNNLIGNTTLSGSIIISGSDNVATPTVKIYGDMQTDGVIKFTPVSKTIDNSISASYVFVSGSTNDLYFSQNGSGFSNTTRLRWIEGNLYTGLLHGGIISATNGGTTFNVSSGSGVIVSLNATTNREPYPTLNYVNWNNITNQSITYLTSSIQTFVAIKGDGTIHQQTTAFSNGDYNNYITLGTVLHQNQSTVNANITYPNVAYGYKQRTYDFVKAFGPLKLDGLAILTSGSLGLGVSGGTAWADGRNYQNNPNSPSYITDTGTLVSKIFRYYASGSTFIQDTNNALGYIHLDPTQYNNNGTLTTVSGNNPTNYHWTIQRIFWYPNSATKGIVAYYGNAQYDTEDLAKVGLVGETFNEVENTKQNAVYLGAILLRKDAVFTDDTTYTIVPAGLFRSVSGGGTSGVSIAGISGTSGTSGVSGTSGLNGTFFGTSGTSGISGAGIQNYYGNFFSTGSQNVAGANIATTASLETTGDASGINIVDSRKITVANTGIYEITFSAQVEKTQGTSAALSIWFQKNGVKIDNSASYTSLVSNSVYQIVTVPTIISLSAGDYLEVVFASDSQYVQIADIAANTVDSSPQAPSFIVTMKQVGVAVGSTSGTSGTSGTSTDITSLNNYTGSAIGISNGLMAYTASLKSTGLVSGSLIESSSYSVVTDRAKTLDLYSYTNDIESYVLFSNIIATTGVGVGGNNNIRYNSSTNVLSVGTISATKYLGGIVSSSAQLTALNSYTSSNDSVINGILQTTASLNTYTGSNDAIRNQILQTTASLNTYTSSNDSVRNRILQTTASLNTYTGSNDSVVQRLMQATASINITTGSLLQIYQTTASLNSKTGSYATTGSNIFVGNQTITGSLFVSSTAISDTTLLASSSNLVLSSGSNLYMYNDGLVSISGSTKLTGSLSVGFSAGTTELQVGSTGVNIGNAMTDRHLVTGSLLVTGSMTIRSGSITMPNRPGVRVTGAGGAKVAVTTLSGSYLNVDWQQGNAWDNSTGTFTAPIAGLYQVNVITRTNSNSLGTISQLIVYKNNTGGTSGTTQIMIEYGSNTTMNHTGGSTISKLEVGDTLKMVVAVGEISFDVNDNFSVAYIG